MCHRVLVFQSNKQIMQPKTKVQKTQRQMPSRHPYFVNNRLVHVDLSLDAWVADATL